MHNARLAITALGVQCSRDTFHNKTLFGYSGDSMQHELQSLVGEVTDDGIIMLRQMMSERLASILRKPTSDAVLPWRTSIASIRFWTCWRRPRPSGTVNHASTAWPLIISTLTTRRSMRAASHDHDRRRTSRTPPRVQVRRRYRYGIPGRVRQESARGAYWLANDNFSDQSILGKDGREVQEQLFFDSDHANAELAGLGKTEIEAVKAFASRQEDIARPAYGWFVYKQLRHSIEVGTTNNDEYLQSQTGNRRFGH